jgi:hypothetical protein
MKRSGMLLKSFPTHPVDLLLFSIAVVRNYIRFLQHPNSFRSVVGEPIGLPSERLCRLLHRRSIYELFTHNNLRLRAGSHQVLSLCIS